MHRPDNKPNRPGFTLIELLVVVAIIGILMSLSAGTYFRFFADQSRRITRVSLGAVETLLTQQWEAVASRARREALDRLPRADRVKPYALASANPPAFLSAPNYRAVNKDLVRVIYIKLSLKRAFPMSFAEILNPGPYDLRPYADYRNKLNALGINAGNLNPRRQPYESAVCLLMALELGPGGAGYGESEISGYTKTFTYTTSGTNPIQVTIRGLVDGWGNPVAFARFPTHSPELNTNAQPSPGHDNDSVDPEGRLTSAGWLASRGRTEYQNALHAVPNRAGSEPQSFKLQPLVVSSGRDQRMGLNWWNLRVTNVGQNQDNIYSHKQ